jgi:hypothetical protein
MAQLNFDASTVAPDQGIPEAVPAGWYNVIMDESEMKPTKDGEGAYLACRFAIVDGQYQGRKLFIRLNLKNKNPIAQEIAYKQLSAICHAVNIIHALDSAQLHNIPLKVKVKVRPATDDYEASNDVTQYKNINEAVLGAAPQAGFAAPAMSPPPVAPPPQQPWGQQAPAMQAAPVAQASPPFAQPAAPAPAASQPWAQPAQQPWQQPAQQAPQQMAPAPASVQAPVAQAAPAAQGAIPPWAR